MKRGPAGIPDRVIVIIVRKKLSQSTAMGGGHRQVDGSK